MSELMRAAAVPTIVAGPALPAPVVALLRQFVADDGASAAALGVVRGDGSASLLACGTTRRWRLDDSGVKAEDPGVLVDLDSPFDLASLTKPIATLGLVVDGLAARRFELETPIADMLPAASASAIARQPLRALLGHGSGWPAWRDVAGEVLADCEPGAWRRRACLGATSEAVRAAVLATPLERALGDSAVYSDLGYLTIGWALEAVGGAPLDAQWADHWRRVVGVAGAVGVEGAVARALTFRRLSAQNAGIDRIVGALAPASTVVATEVWPRRCADGRALQGEVHDDNAATLDGVAGHAGLFGSVRTVSAWAGQWLGAARAPAFGPASAGLAGLLTPDIARALLSTRAAHQTTWRLGWDTPSGPQSTAGSMASAQGFGHLGFVGTSVWIDPTRDVAVVLLTNRVHPERARVTAIRALRPTLHNAIWRWLDG